MSALNNEVKAPPVATTLISRTNALIFGAILAAFLVVGTFFDLQISTALFDSSSAFGIFFAAYGEMPAGLALVVAGVLLIKFRNRASVGKAIGQIIGAALLLALGAMILTFMPTLYLNTSPAILAAIGLAIGGLTTWGVLRLSSAADRRVAIRVAVVLLVVVIAEMILINLIKIGWQRPRMRLLEENSSVLFSPWYSPGNPAKAELMAQGISSEEFKSFPSGHVGNATTMILLTVLIPLRMSLARFAPLFFWFGALWAGLVALSRVIVGAHFVSDTVIGATVTLVVILLAYRIAFSQKFLGRVHEV